MPDLQLADRRPVLLAARRCGERFDGSHLPNWLPQVTEELFVSDRRLRDRKSLPRARGEWALDSGGFTELRKYGGWTSTTPAEYAARVRRYRDEIGRPLWAAPQDCMLTLPPTHSTDPRVPLQ